MGSILGSPYFGKQPYNYLDNCMLRKGGLGGGQVAAAAPAKKKAKCRGCRVCLGQANNVDRGLGFRGLRV